MSQLNYRPKLQYIYKQLNTIVPINVSTDLRDIPTSQDRLNVISAMLDELNDRLGDTPLYAAYKSRDYITGMTPERDIIGPNGSLKDELKFIVDELQLVWDNLIDFYNQTISAILADEFPDYAAEDRLKALAALVINLQSTVESKELYNANHGTWEDTELVKLKDELQDCMVLLNAIDSADIIITDMFSKVGNAIDEINSILDDPVDKDMSDVVNYIYEQCKTFANLSPDAMLPRFQTSVCLYIDDVVTKESALLTKMMTTCSASVLEYGVRAIADTFMYYHQIAPDILHTLANMPDVDLPDNVNNGLQFIANGLDSIVDLYTDRFYGMYNAFTTAMDYIKELLPMIQQKNKACAMYRALEA